MPVARNGGQRLSPHAINPTTPTQRHFVLFPETKRTHNHKRQLSTSNKASCLQISSCSTMHDEKAKKTGEIIFSVTQNLTCELPQFLRDFGDYACKLKNYIILSQFVILLNVL